MCMSSTCKRPTWYICCMPAPSPPMQCPDEVQLLGLRTLDAWIDCVTPDVLESACSQVEYTHVLPGQVPAYAKCMRPNSCFDSFLDCSKAYQAVVLRECAAVATMLEW